MHKALTGLAPNYLRGSSFMFLKDINTLRNSDVNLILVYGEKVLQHYGIIFMVTLEGRRTCATLG